MATIGIAATTSGASLTTSRLTLSGYVGDERSETSGSPEELYLFNEADTNYWSYTSSDYDIAYGGRTYQAVAIKRDNIEHNYNSLKTQVQIEVEINNVFARQFISAPIDRPIKITIYRRHATSPNEFVTYWTGFVRAVKFNPKTISIVSGVKIESLKRNGLMLKYQRICGLPLYSTRCGISKANTDFYTTGTITAISGKVITATAFGTEDEGWWVGGIFQKSDGSITQKITAHSSTTVTLSRVPSTLSVGDTFTVRTGCDHSRTTCRIKFSNELNYGGQPYIPDKNPFEGDAIA